MKQQEQQHKRNLEILLIRPVSGKRPSSFRPGKHHIGYDFKNGVYLGGVADSKRNGLGVVIFDDGNVLVCEWQKDQVKGGRRMLLLIPGNGIFVCSFYKSSGEEGTESEQRIQIELSLRMSEEINESSLQQLASVVKNSDGWSQIVQVIHKKIEIGYRNQTLNQLDGFGAIWDITTQSILKWGQFQNGKLNGFGRNIIISSNASESYTLDGFFVNEKLHGESNCCLCQQTVQKQSFIIGSFSEGTCIAQTQLEIGYPFEFLKKSRQKFHKAQVGYFHTELLIEQFIDTKQLIRVVQSTAEQRIEEFNKKFDNPSNLQNETQMRFLQFGNEINTETQEELPEFVLDADGSLLKRLSIKNSRTKRPSSVSNANCSRNYSTENWIAGDSLGMRNYRNSQNAFTGMMIQQVSENRDLMETKNFSGQSFVRSPNLCRRRIASVFQNNLKHQAVTEPEGNQCFRPRNHSVTVQKTKRNSMIQPKNYTLHGDTDAAEAENSNYLNATSSSFQVSNGISRSNFSVSIPQKQNLDQQQPQYNRLSSPPSLPLNVPEFLSSLSFQERLILQHKTTRHGSVSRNHQIIRQSQNGRDLGNITYNQKTSQQQSQPMRLLQELGVPLSTKNKQTEEFIRLKKSYEINTSDNVPEKPLVPNEQVKEGRQIGQFQDVEVEQVNSTKNSNFTLLKYNKQLLSQDNNNSSNICKNNRYFKVSAYEKPDKSSEVLKILLETSNKKQQLKNNNYLHPQPEIVTKNQFDQFTLQQQSKQICNTNNISSSAIPADSSQQQRKKSIVRFNFGSTNNGCSTSSNTSTTPSQHVFRRDKTPERSSLKLNTNSANLSSYQISLTAE